MQLLQELCTVFNVDLPCRVKSSQLGILSDPGGGGGAIITPQPSSCSYICQHCLVHLGDIGEGSPLRPLLEGAGSASHLVWPLSSLQEPDEPGGVVLPSRRSAGPLQRWVHTLVKQVKRHTCPRCSPYVLAHQAARVSPAGQPYNQLAILASSKGDHLTTIFYYCRSIAVKFPFPAASTNLQKALSKALDR